MRSTSWSKQKPASATEQEGLEQSGGSCSVALPEAEDPHRTVHHNDASATLHDDAERRHVRAGGSPGAMRRGYAAVALWPSK